MPTAAPAAKKIPWVKLAVVAVVLVAIAVWLLLGLNLRAYYDQGMAVIRGVSPMVFFIGMALLPAVGVPALAFVLSAGPVWG